jgi:hypothetical protein
VVGSDRNRYFARVDVIVLAVLIVIAVGAGIVVLAATAFSRNRHFNEVDRFHRASRMTTEWSRAGVTRPVIAEQEEEPREARERNSH